MRKSTIAAPALIAVGACAACCAPLIAAPVIALFAAGGAALALVGQIALAAVVVAVAIAYMLWRQSKRRAPASVSDCGCAPGAGCNTGDSCELPPQRASQ